MFVFIRSALPGALLLTLAAVAPDSVSAQMQFAQSQQARPAPSPPAQTSEASPRIDDKSPDGNSRTVRTLDRLFAALKAAPDEGTAKAVEGRIWAQWLASPSDTATLLMSRVGIAMEAKDLALADRLLTAIIEIRPDFTEAWNRRATLRYLRKDFGAALADLREVLAREPRHFAALMGLGLILQELGDDRRALDAYRRAVDLHPRLPNVADRIRDLTEKVEGRDI
ncbi:MAG TPA: tetratricopeptide repeat protein [Xanthobacteraceae bacterium]|nr:tetratricopeptide repeat protein [Xanthobacteraceae bacterium]